MVSVCLATYNGARYLQKQIESIVSQLSGEDELVISDDGSTDGTADIVASFRDPRIRFLENSGRHGVNGNFENALSHAAGDIIFLSDQDDVWVPGKVKVCLQRLETCDCVVHDVFITDGNLNIVSESFFRERHCREGFWHNWMRNGYLGCAMAFRKEVLEDVLPIPERLPVWHDIWIGSICDLKYRLRFDPFKGSYFRRHELTASVTAKSRLGIGRMALYRAGVLWFVIKRLGFNR